MKRQKTPLFVAGLVLATFASSALASSPVSNVGTSVVNEGEWSVENRVGYTRDSESASDNRRLRLRQHLDYGFTDSYAIRLVTEQENRFGNNTEHRSVTLENRFQVFEKRTDGFDAGFRLIYGHADHDKRASEIDVRMMWAVPFSNGWEWRHNTVAERDVGAEQERGVTLEFRNQVTYALPQNADSMFKKLQLGVEMFNDFSKLNALRGGYSRQDHQLGPVIKASFHNGAYVQTGYRAGVSKLGADHSYKLFFGVKF